MALRVSTIVVVEKVHATRVEGAGVAPAEVQRLRGALFHQPAASWAQYTRSVMRSIRLAAALFVPLVVLAQDVKRPLLSSHDRVDGPFGGEYHVEDLQVFADGKVVYIEEGTKTMGGKPERSALEATVGSDEMRRLEGLLDSPEIRALPKKVPSKTRPIDFFWQKSLEVNRPDKTQKIQIENFYPFLNAHQPIYPKALVELECSVQDIKLEAARRPRPKDKDEDDWCGAIRAKIEPAKAGPSTGSHSLTK
jgi:hypothetical protein